VPNLGRVISDQSTQFKKLLENSNVVCQRCGFGQIARIGEFSLGAQGHHVKWFNCLKCTQLNFDLYKGTTGGRVPSIFTFVTVLSFPSASRPFVLPTTLPGNIASDYREAAKLLAVSPPASAAFSRRCLQTILKNQGYAKSKLVHQIDDVLKETNPAKVVPHYMTTRLDAVRNFGNFSAHETEDRATAEILDVQPGEAEWCLEIIEDLIEHYFVRPAAEQAKIDSLNAKLAGAGKPEIKTPSAATRPDEGDA
jgi:hypothetical protein